MRSSRWLAVALLLTVASCATDDDVRAEAGDDRGTATEPTTTEPTTTGPTTTEPTTDTPATTPGETTGARALEIRPVLQIVLPDGAAHDPSVPEDCRTPAEGWDLASEVFAPELHEGEAIACYRLSPTALTDEIVAEATAQQLEPGVSWQVGIVIHDDRIDEFNDIAGACFESAPSCPTGLLALVSDGVVISAPSISAPSFEADQISISGDWTEVDAEQLADRIG